MEFKTIKQPYLIQRGSFRDIKDDEIVGLDSLISYDYMGSSEFECGALPQSLRRMTYRSKGWSLKLNKGVYPAKVIYFAALDGFYKVDINLTPDLNLEVRARENELTSTKEKALSLLMKTP